MISRNRQKEFICKPCRKELKDGKCSKNVQNCPNSDTLGSHVNDHQNSQHNVQENRIHNENNIRCDFPANYTTPEYHFDKLLSVYMLP